MKYQKEANYILSLLKSAVIDIAPPLPTDDLNWDVIYSLSTKHRIYIPMYFAMQKLPEDVKQSITNLSSYSLAYKQYLVTDANRTHYWKQLKSDFDTAGIDYMLLKGSVSKHLYPDTAMRMMRDMDILYRGCENNTLISIFEKYGFQVSKIEPKEISFKMQPLKLHIELQKYLVNEIYEDWFKYLENIWERSTQKSAHEYIMSNEDFYIYHIIHMAKHFKNGGIGILHILDTYVINKGYNLNRDYIANELEKIHLNQFENVILDLINVWFEGYDSNEELDKLSYYILRNGAFGSKKQQEVNIAVKNNGRSSLVRRLFPRIEIIANYYGDFVTKHKWSLPFYWIRLNIERIFRDKKTISASLKNINNISQEQIDKAKELFDYCGLE